MRFVAADILRQWTALTNMFVKLFEERGEGGEGGEGGGGEWERTITCARIYLEQKICVNISQFSKRGK